MIRLVVTCGRDSERQACDGYHSIALTPLLIEDYLVVHKTGNFADLVSFPRFAVRQPNGRPFRIAGRDGGRGPTIEVRFRHPRKLLMRMYNYIALKVENVH